MGETIIREQRQRFQELRDETLGLAKREAELLRASAGRQRKQQYEQEEDDSRPVTRPRKPPTGPVNASSAPALSTNINMYNLHTHTQSTDGSAAAGSGRTTGRSGPQFVTASGRSTPYSSRSTSPALSAQVLAGWLAE